MISRRKYFVICLMMAVLFFLFQFSQVMRETWNHYTNNEYARDNLTTADAEWSAEKRNQRVAGSIPAVLYVGDRENEVGRTLEQWCVYNKYELQCEPVLPVYAQVKALPSILFIDGKSVNINAYLSELNSYMKYQVPVVFLRLPDVIKIRQNQELQEILGIEKVERNLVEVEGIRLFAGGLLGGEAVYQAQNAKEAQELQDLNLKMPWYITGAGTKTYMVGLLDEKLYRREDFPGIIWRNSMGNSKVFAVNGDYMTEEAGFGFLNLFLYEMSDYALYPIVNAQNMLFVDFPDFSGADEAAVTALYSRDAKSVQQDVFWPSIYSMITRNDLKPTCFFMTQYDKVYLPKISAQQVNFYLQQVNEVGGEAGKSMHFGPGMSLENKMEMDEKFYLQAGCPYHFRAAYLEAADSDTGEVWNQGNSFTKFATVTGRASEEYPLLSYYTDTVTLQDITHEADCYSYTQDLKMRSLLTSLGYSNTLIDFHRVLWPEKPEDSWEVYFDKIYSNISTYWSGLVYFDQTTLSESDYRVRNFLNLDYTQNRDGQNIYLLIQNGGEDCYFLLRTHGEEVTAVQNGEYRCIEQDAYLIHAQNSHVVIQLRDAQEMLKYQGPFAK